jgi:peptidoglycan/LPS O-acetylase OafA/YrhL
VRDAYSAEIRAMQAAHDRPAEREIARFLLIDSDVFDRRRKASSQCSKQDLFLTRESVLRSESGTTQRSTPKAKTRFLEIDGLRGIAIWLVLLGHFFVLEYSRELGGVSPLALNLGRKFPWGVDLFFVISGFLIGGILLDHRHSRALLKTFYLRRALRIWPLYFLIVLLLMGPMYYMGFPAQARYVPYWSYLFFGHNLWMSAGFWALFAFGPLWSLGVEEQFYVVAPLLFRRASDASINALIWVAIGAAIAMRSACIYLPSIDPGTFTLCRLDAIALGLFGACLIRNRTMAGWPGLDSRRLSRLVALLLPGFVGLVICSRLPTCLEPLAPSYVSVFFLAVLLLAISHTEGIVARSLRQPLLVTSGKYCYFLYLFHYTVLDNVGLVIENRLLARLVALGVLFFFAAVSWRLLEAPLIALGHRHCYDSEPESVPQLGSPAVSP